jgi:antitoxin VapB
MPISIKNDETELLARKLAELTGETLTEAVRTAVAERYDRLRRARSGRSLADELNAIAIRCAKRPLVSHLSADEILGYDDSGIPTQ